MPQNLRIVLAGLGLYVLAYIAFSKLKKTQKNRARYFCPTVLDFEIFHQNCVE
jgi:hypothetical protein